jgi:hypothetical protein
VGRREHRFGANFTVRIDARSGGGEGALEHAVAADRFLSEAQPVKTGARRERGGEAGSWTISFPAAPCRGAAKSCRLAPRQNERSKNGLD